jgi:hypothetical protein
MPVMTPRTWGGGGETAREMSCLCVCGAMRTLPSPLPPHSPQGPRHTRSQSCQATQL